MNWYGISVCDPRAADLYSRHYSSKKSGKSISDWKSHGIGGNGERMALMTADSSALFIWILQKYGGNSNGINCSVFRNEGKIKSSELILEAESLASSRWPNEKRFFTYVDPNQIKSVNPGYCFQVAGWKKCGTTKRGLLILEKYVNN